MAFQEEELKAEIDRALQSLSEQEGVGFAAEIQQILYKNIERGRIQAFVEDDLGCVRDYVKKVADKYKELSPFIKELQIERADKVWTSLLKQMQLWAYNYLIRKGFYKSINTQVIASECADEAALAMVDAYFPYDTDFAPWAHVVVNNACLKYMRKGTKKSIVPQQNIVELDEALSTMEDPVMEVQKHREDASDLSNAIAQLSKARREVIELYYFKGFSLLEIAKKMGKRVSAIHSLHFNALQDLRKILDESRNNL